MSEKNREIKTTSVGNY
uniref:Uncharacterized protein n=1 Tax=Anguilla anguilla TaxID=7936 RepID=A0A0E9PEX1_ANGAN